MPEAEDFDFAYIDADKPGYDGYYEECLARLRTRGMIMLDNVLLSGRVLDPPADDESAQAIAALNEKLAADERVEIAMLGIADGVTLARWAAWSRSGGRSWPSLRMPRWSRTTACWRRSCRWRRTARSSTRSSIAILAERLADIAARYEDARVNAWTVWTPRSHTATAELLRDAGHHLDAQPRLMAVDGLDRFEAPDLDGVEWTRDPDPEEFARVTDEGFGMGDEGFERAVLGRFDVPGSHQYLARLDGKPATTAMVIDADGDAGIYAIATVPEARGKGLARNLMLQSLHDARERGCETSTLQATKEGFRIYQRMGYDEMGAAMM